MRRLRIMLPAEGDATSFYRGMGPLARLQQDYPGGLSLIVSPHYTEANMRMSDVFFAQRPYSRDHLNVMKMARAAGVPIWVDYDDDLFSVPRHNPAHKLYANPETMKRIGTMCAMADVLSVSTEALRSKLARLNPNISVVPNAIDERRFWWRNPRKTPREKKIFWRGSATHTMDVLPVRDALIEVAHLPDLKDWKFVFMGDDPWVITSYLPPDRVEILEGTTPDLYMRKLEDTHPAIMIVPLEDDEFNRSKSNCAWIEGSFAGATVIAPELPEFKMPGVINYTDARDFKDCLVRAIASAEIGSLFAKNEESWAHIKSSLTLGTINKRRIDILKRLIDQQPKGFLS